jgi:hypothetical protein
MKTKNGLWRNDVTGDGLGLFRRGLVDAATRCWVEGMAPDVLVPLEACNFYAALASPSLPVAVAEGVTWHYGLGGDEGGEASPRMSDEVTESACMCLPGENL